MLVGTDHPWKETGSREREAQSHPGHRHQRAQHSRTEHQAPLGGPWVSGCYPSWDGGFIGFETVLTKIRLSCPAARALCPFRHEQSHQLCTLPAARDTAQPSCWGQGQQEDSSGILVFSVVLEAPGKANQCPKSAPGSAGSLRKASWAKEEGLAPIPKGSPSHQPGLHKQFLALAMVPSSLGWAKALECLLSPAEPAFLPSPRE